MILVGSIMSSGFLDSLDVHRDLCWMESVRLGHMHISCGERPSFGESRVINFVSRQHIRMQLPSNHESS